MTHSIVIIPGIKFGSLTVLTQLEHKDKRGTYWKCICKCGKEVTARRDSLVSGDKKSCGCLKSEATARTGRNNKGRGLVTTLIKRVLYNYKHSARAKNVPFLLEYTDFLRLLEQNCYYCGMCPTNKSYNYTKDTAFIYNGIDRKDNTQGYTLENCVPCCSICNKAKRDMPYNEFINWIERLTQHWNTVRIVV